MNIKIYTLALGVCLTMPVSAQAVPPITNVLNFINLSSGLGTNSVLKCNGVTNGLGVTLSVDGSSGANEYVYTVSVTNLDFGDDTVADELTFDVRVSAFGGGSITSLLSGTSVGNNGIAIIGTNGVNVTLRSALWTASGDMQLGQSIGFSAGNITVKNSVDGDGIGTFDGFDQVTIDEYGGNSHLAVIGEGTNLPERDWDVPTAYNYNLANVEKAYVSSARGGTLQADWGAQLIDWGITVIVYPPASTVIMME